MEATRAKAEGNGRRAGRQRPDGPQVARFAVSPPPDAVHASGNHQESVKTRATLNGSLSIEPESQPLDRSPLDADRTPSLTAPPWGFLAALCLARLALYLLSSGPLAYGYMSDEFYYLDGARQLSWGYVDHPPLSLALLRLVDTTLGDSLLALRLLPALAHCAVIAGVALLAREIGGGRTAQRLAALAALVAPVYLGISALYSMNAFEPVVWVASAWLLARIRNGAEPRTWLWLGAILGLGLLNKISVLWLGFGLALGLVATPERRWLVTPWPWLAATIAAAIALPFAVWQVENGWPLLEFMANARNEKMVEKTPLQFTAEQLVIMHPVLAPFWLGGLTWLFTRAGRRHRLLGWLWLGTFAVLAASGATRANYLGPAYTVLLPAGGLMVERITRARELRWLPGVAATAFVLAGLLGAPLATPLLSPARYVAYERALGVKAPIDQTGELGALPLHYALRFGWDELRWAVTQAEATLSPSEHAQAVILGSWFGDTGMFNFRRAHEGGLPAISGHNHYWLWGPGTATGEVVIALRPSPEQLRKWFHDVRYIADVDCSLCLPEVDRLRVYVCRKPRHPIAEWWPEVKDFI